MVKQFANILSTLLLSFFLSTLLLVLLFKFVPVPYTPLMCLRHMEAYREGRSLDIQHEWVPLEDISPNLIAAVVNHEDAKFYEHRVLTGMPLCMRMGRISIMVIS